MKSAISILVVVLIISTAGFAQGTSDIPPYYLQSNLLSTTPGVAGGAAGAFFNPAVLGIERGIDLQFHWTDDMEGTIPVVKNWALLSKFGNFGFNVHNWKYNTPGILINGSPDIELIDYSAGLGFGDAEFAFGMGYTWSTGTVTNNFTRDNIISAGFITRPFRYLSTGAAYNYTPNRNHQRTIVDVGFRPLGNEKVTVFADGVFSNDDVEDDFTWAAGAAFEPLPGIGFQAKYFESEVFQIGLSLSFGIDGVSSIAHYDKNSHRSYSTHSIRAGNHQKSFIEKTIAKDKLIVEMPFNNKLEYRKYILFDEGRSLKETLDELEQVKNDDRVAGIALSITEEFNASWELVWEVREKIKEVRAAGKKVYVFIERVEQRGYYLASAADKIMVDPEGLYLLYGFNLGRTYQKNMLDKLGIGFDEWRFFTYKSAYESFSRTNMSEADKEQRKALCDGWYEILKADICESREISESEYERLLNEVMIFSPDSMLVFNLADTMGRWPDMAEWIESADGKKKMINEKTYSVFQSQETEWGIPPRIAIIYALGTTSLNTGINARRLQKVISKARKDKKIKAVVFRADSPGGDALASDIVAIELKKTTEEKPVIVSQGWVAGSGGYWISMYGDKIVASPWTITGSIGVIGGFIYNDGFGDKIGFTYDHTQAGKHADIGGGIRMPFIGLQIPDRNLTSDERKIVEKMIKNMYRVFTEKVAEGRGMTPEEVDKIGQGRIYTGTTGKELGLVDELGGLEKAIEMAREAAGIKSDRKVQLVEMPGPDLFDPSIFTPNLFGISGVLFSNGLEENPELEYYRMIIESKGRPLVLLPPEFWMLDD